MQRTGLARPVDDDAVRWIAVRHAADHTHAVATLARPTRASGPLGDRLGSCAAIAGDETERRREPAAPLRATAGQ
jgi:hypothetical protein